MGWNQKSSRFGRAHRRPDCEALEVRQLLSTTDPAPAASSSLGAVVRSNGTVDYDAVIRASAARATYGVDGTGSNVAVIDTGVNYNNPAFGSGPVGSATNKVVAGVDFTGSPNGVIPTWQHGTGVAGLVASTDKVNPGVAPGAGIVALRVFGDDNAGSFDNIARALDWVVQNHAQYRITAVNLSVSDGGSYQSNPFGNDGSVGQQITGAVATLDALNIPVVVAAGNAFDGKTQGQGFASIIPDTISVTATDETKMTAKGGDPLAADAQRLGAAKGGASATDIAAPGVNLVAPSGPAGTATEEGTSFATPQVTGTIVLLQQAYRKAFGTLPTVDQLDEWLTAGADKIHDAATGIDIGRLNVAGSLGVLTAQIKAVVAATQPVQAAAQVLQPSTPVANVVAAPPVAAPPPVATPPAATTPPPVATPPPAVVAPPAATPPAAEAKPVADAPPAQPMTEVIVNGASIGQVATSQLAGTYARLFALTKGVASNLRAWAPGGSTIDLGASKPSGEAVRPRAVAVPARNRAKGAATVHAAVVPTLAHAKRPMKAATGPVGLPKVAATRPA